MQRVITWEESPWSELPSFYHLDLQRHVRLSHNEFIQLDYYGPLMSAGVIVIVSAYVGFIHLWYV